jgi:mono/diheme cytochrome c family protein
MTTPAARACALASVCLAAVLATPGHAADGKTLFGTDCGLCHQRDGAGVPGSFPRLAGRIGLIAAKPDGKTYLTHVLAFGMSGTVTVDGKMIMGYMPAFGQVPAADVAAILTYVSSLGGTAPVTFTADEIAAGRKAGLTPLSVHQERDKLVAAKVVP